MVLSTYREMMNHVTVQHADGREGDMVANDDELALAGVESKPVAIRRILQVEVPSHLVPALLEGLVHILPGEPPFPPAR